MVSLSLDEIPTQYYAYVKIGHISEMGKSHPNIPYICVNVASRKYFVEAQTYH